MSGTVTSYSIHRWTRQSRIGVTLGSVAIFVLAFGPLVLSAGIMDRLIVLFIYVIMAAMWNALAGYGGLVSIGQQMFFGLGAYFTIRVANTGVDPFMAAGIAALINGVLAWPISFFMLRLRGGEFAIGMWVLASIAHLLVNLDSLIQGETGISLISLNAYETQMRQAMIYWLALGAMAGILTLLFVILRSRTGIAVQAIRDNEEAAASVGVNLEKTKRRLFVLAAFGIGAAGALWLAQATSFQPKTYFSVQWTAYMIFMVLVGGIGKFEGAILGAILFFLVETWFASTGVVYLIFLGAIAMVFSLFLPKGLWGVIENRFGIQLLPVGYFVRTQPPEK